MLQLVGHCPECQHQIVPGIDFSFKKGLSPDDSFEVQE